jgi:Fur family ferric uptake transcriptional regulator
MERQTRQRTAIQRVFREARHPLDPQQVLAAARRFVPGMGIATVYRTINALVDDHQLVPVTLPGESPRYEPAGRGHHHHFQCRTCSRVFEIDGCPGKFDRFAPRGFELDGHELILYGRCEACATG